MDFWKLVLLCCVDGGHELWAERAWAVALVDSSQRDGSSGAPAVRSEGL